MTRVRLAVVAAIVLVIPLTACGPAGQTPAPGVDNRPSESDVRAAIAQLNDAWDAAVRAGDFEAQAATYTEDGIRMQPDMPALVGRGAIRAWLQAQSEQYTFEGANQLEEVLVLGDNWALARFTGSFIRTPRAGGAPVQEREKWLSILKRQPDGTWKWHRDAGSSDIATR